MKKNAGKPKAKESKARESRFSVLKKKLAAKIPARKKAPALKPAKKLFVKAKKAAVPAQAEIPIQEMKVEESKFYTGAVAAKAYQKSTVVELGMRELPARYEDDVVVLQVRDPWWAHTYWDLRSETISRLRNEYSTDFDRARWVLRSYDVSFVNFDGTNAHRFFDTGIDVDARNWYLNFGSPGTTWCVDLGFILTDGRFITVVRSNVISLPLDAPSWITDEEWMIPDDEFRRLYGLSVGLGPNVSSPVGKLWQERLKKDVSSRGLASMGVSSPVRKPAEKRPFWLVVDAELIVYGATEPDASVTVQGRPIKLRKDGTFTLRFALPDGRQDIPVVAKSAHIDETRTITPIVTRKTTRNP
ncbi:MAG TPA: hypothetical protein DCL35_02870 [Candidatus Omnitrophica bacterium]|nr:hypothetical protein [Candidatus Omnitrophota bacterium]